MGFVRVAAGRLAPRLWLGSADGGWSWELAKGLESAPVFPINLSSHFFYAVLPLVWRSELPVLIVDLDEDRRLSVALFTGRRSDLDGDHSQALIPMGDWCGSAERRYHWRGQPGCDEVTRPAGQGRRPRLSLVLFAEFGGHDVLRHLDRSL